MAVFSVTILCVILVSALISHQLTRFFNQAWGLVLDRSLEVGLDRELVGDGSVR